ncbi:zinc-binding dehydrogenase [Mitsuokella sp. AF21-1AC]|uniref:zinc-binding dehydrogenase n=1 Tax=Mitsuokella sp. AF21-1AC TaxID=2292235 RepID=UPI000E4EBB19|nr:zinc-binding dehydrogenase [Mitsuokella sp. AF21-1AC]RGS71219.1 sorbitol dehydrogenase [Mitsuokella sp. AF21-1AC]
MKALVKMEPGAGHWEVIDKPEPVPGEGQVKIKVEYIGICGSDLHTYEGHYNVNAKGLTIGHEFAGVVAEVGPGVTNVKVGDRVTSETTFTVCGKCRYCKEGLYNLCPTRKGLGTQQDGAMAQYVLARAKSCHILPENVTTRQASITEAACCAHHGVAKAKINPGDIVLVLGPGPIGLLTAQCVMAKGGRVVMTGLTQDAGRLQIAKEKFGVEYIVDVQKDDVKALVNKLTDGYGADVCYDCTGAVPSMQLGMDLLRKQGQYVQIGLFARDVVEVDFSKIIQKELVVSGSRSQNTHDWEPTLKLMSEGKINADKMITHEVGIDEWDKAYHLLKSGQATKIVMHPIG